MLPQIKRWLTPLRVVAVTLILSIVAVSAVAGGTASALPETGGPTTTAPVKARTAAEKLAYEVAVWHWYAELNRQAEFVRNMDRLAAWLRAQSSYKSGQCGGDLPPCYVMMRESRGNITAQNPRSTASGKWQFLDSTWGRYGGYAKARYAPERVQDARARDLWNHGRGCSHWNACR